jgi:hypothetical protein
MPAPKTVFEWIIKLFIILLAALSLVCGISILYASYRLWHSTDAATLERYKTMLEAGLKPALSALLTFLAGIAAIKGALIAADNTQRLAKGKDPEPIELF